MSNSIATGCRVVNNSLDILGALIHYRLSSTTTTIHQTNVNQTIHSKHLFFWKVLTKPREALIPLLN